MLKVKCVSVDMYGFLGRNFHPSLKDIGTVWTVVHLVTELSEPTESHMIDSSEAFEVAETAVVAGMHSDEAAGSDFVFTTLYCVNAKGEKRTFTDSEVIFYRS